MKEVIKNLLVLVPLFAIGLGLQSCVQKEHTSTQTGLQPYIKESRSIIGTWSGLNRGHNQTWVFSKDGHVSTTIDSLTAGGRNFRNESGETVDRGYTVDYTKNPCWIDLTVKDKQGLERQEEKGIFMFDNDSTIKMCLGSDARPKYFGASVDENLIIELNRAK